MVCAPLGHTKLSKALTLGIHLQKLVVQIGGQVIDQKNYVSAGPFRYTFLRDGLVGKAMQRQLIVTRVAIFLMDAIAAHGARPKPFLVMSPLEEKGNEQTGDPDLRCFLSMRNRYSELCLFCLRRRCRDLARSCSNKPRAVQRFRLAVPQGCGEERNPDCRTWAHIFCGGGCKRSGD